MFSVRGPCVVSFAGTFIPVGEVACLTSGRLPSTNSGNMYVEVNLAKRWEAPEAYLAFKRTSACAAASKLQDSRGMVKIY